MVNLVLKQMQKQPVEALALNAIFAVNFDQASEFSGLCVLSHCDETSINFALFNLKHPHGGARLRVGPGGWTARAALHCVHIEAIDDQIVIQGGANASENASSGLREIK